MKEARKFRDDERSGGRDNESVAPRWCVQRERMDSGEYTDAAFEVDEDVR